MLLKRLITIILILFSFAIDSNSQDVPAKIELAAQIAIKSLNSNELQNIDVEKKILFIENLVSTSLNIHPNFIIPENTPIPLIIGVFYSMEKSRHFMYLFTREQETYRKQAFSPESPIFGVIAAKCRNYEGNFLLEMILSTGANLHSWSKVDMYILQWDNKNWQKFWKLDVNYREILQSLNLNSRFGILEPECYKQYANFVDFNNDRISELLVTCQILAGSFLPSTYLEDTIDIEFIFVREGNKFTFNNVWIKPFLRNVLREFIWSLRCSDRIRAERLVLYSSVINNAEDWGLGALDSHWKFIDYPEQVPEKERKLASSVIQKRNSLLFWEGEPPFFVAVFEKLNNEYKLSNIQRYEHLNEFQKINSYSIYKSTTIPQIDGIIQTGEWDDVGYNEAGFVPFNPENWNSAKDLSGRIKATWSDDKIYFVAEVNDDVIIQEWQRLSLWRGDHLELWFDLDPEGDAEITDVNNDDFQIGLSPGNFVDIPSEIYCWLPKNRRGGIPEAEIASKKTKEGYIIEASIPFKFLNIQPQNENVFGFTFLISDTDSKRVPQKCMISIFPEFEYANPTTWGNLYLYQ